MMKEEDYDDEDFYIVYDIAQLFQFWETINANSYQSLRISYCTITIKYPNRNIKWTDGY